MGRRQPERAEPLGKARRRMGSNLGQKKCR
jgi:hypothetical protein